MAASGHFVTNFKTKQKLRIDLNWPEMRSKVLFGHPNGRRRPFYQTTFKKKFRIDLKWPEMRSKVNFGDPKWPPAPNISGRVR